MYSYPQLLTDINFKRRYLYRYLDLYLHRVDEEDRSQGGAKWVKRLRWSPGLGGLR